MTDRELLELAAKAAGIEAVRSRLQDPMHQDLLIKKSLRNPFQSSGPWNPLTDDGDAMRLAVKLGMWFYIGTGKDASTSVCMPEFDNVERHNDDASAATRRAIVRAAAAIATQTESKGDV